MRSECGNPPDPSAVERLLQWRCGLGLCLGGGQPGDFALDQDAGLNQFGHRQLVGVKKIEKGVVELVEGQIGHIGPAGRPLEDLYEALDFKLPDGLPHDDAADLELFGQLSFRRHAFPGLEPARENRRLELVHDCDRDAVLFHGLECHPRTPFLFLKNNLTWRMLFV